MSLATITKVFILCFLGIIVLGIVTQVGAVLRNYKFEVINSSFTRLCSNKTMLTVNGQFPGPTIYARRGDLVIIDVINNSDQNITIHWHGVKMPRYPWSDGPEYVTQCPITPGTRFRQQMILSDEEGTLWWHAHSDWSRNSVYGAIIILPPKTQAYPFLKPHAEFPILLGEWWKSDVQQVCKKYLASGGHILEASDAFLINGQPGDLYPCSPQDTYKLRVEFGKTYMMRLVNAVMNSVMFFKIAKHNLTVVGTDGAYTKPLRTDYVAISPGQTIDLLVEANQPPSHYYVGARLLGTEESVTTPTTGIFEYVGNYAPPSSPLLPSFPDINDSAASLNFTSQLRSLGNDVDVPKNITKYLFYTLSINTSPCYKGSCLGPERVLTSINNVTMLLPSNTSILDSYYRGISGVYTSDFPDFPPFPFSYSQDEFDINESRPRFGTAVSVLEYNTTVELVFQGTNLAGGVGHPMHLHGYSFYVVGLGFGDFDAIKDQPNYNLVDPPLMENIVVARNGWTVIRFKANNPGVWYMHCHFEMHQSLGMKMAFIVRDGKGPDEKMLPPPPDMPRCTKQLSSDHLLFSHTHHNPVDSN